MEKDKELEEIINKLEQQRQIRELTAYLEERHYTEPQPIKCKWCGSEDIMKYGIRNGVQEYICLKCKRKFNAKDAPYKMRSTVEQMGSG